MHQVLRVIPTILLSAVACSPSFRAAAAPASTPAIRPRAAAVAPSGKADGSVKPPDSRKAAIEALARAPLAFEPLDDRPDVFVARTPAYTLRVGPAWADLWPSPLARRGAGRDAGRSAGREPGRDAIDALDATPRSDDDARRAGGRGIRLRLIGARADARSAPQPALPGTVNYVMGNDPARWRTGVPTYARVRYDAIYPGIDIVYYGAGREIEYDFLVAPGARPDRIALGFERVGALALRDNGDLELTHEAEVISLRAPRAWQTIDGRQHAVDVRYLLDDNADGGDRTVRLALGAYDTTQPLVIDPVLSYAAALGGGGQDEGNAVAVDATGHVYVAGLTRSMNFPATGAPAGHFDLFLTKLDPAGSVLISSSYIGGSGADEARGLAIDDDGNAYITGVTRSSDFPTRNPLRPTLAGDADAFVLKIATNGGGLLFSTYLGGSGLDEGTGIAIDNARNVHVTGATRSTDFPTTSAAQAASGGQLDAFVTRLSPGGGGPLYSTYLGGSGTDHAHAIATDASGNVTVVGATSSPNFPVLSAHRGTPAGYVDGFVTRVTSAGSLAFSTYLGGSDIDAAQGVVIDTAGRSYVTGSTASADFPVVAALQPASAGALDAFITGYHSTGGAPFFSTYLGGSGSDRGRGITRDAFDRLYVVGQTFSANFPAVRPVQAAIGGNRDTFVATLAPPYQALTYATYLGGSNNDDGLAVAADRVGRAYVTGATMYAWPGLAGASDAFVMRLSSGVEGADSDGDLMPDEWETQYNLDPERNDAEEDADGDGVLNREELAAGTHPTGFFTRYLAEGATGEFFDSQIALFNPGSSTAIVLLRFLRENQPEIPYFVSLPAHARQTLDAEQIPGLEQTSFSTVVEADLEVVVDRTMTWDTNGYGSHAETAVSDLSRTWYLAEGATHGAFDLYYLLQNPNGTAANVTIRYLRPAGNPPIVKTYPVGARSRVTIHVDDVVSDTDPSQTLKTTDVSAIVLSDQPILIERAMYMTSQGRLWNIGHASSGVTAPSREWFFAEGSTGTYFDMYLLLANPTTTPAEVTLQYLLLSGEPVTVRKHLAPESRLTVPVDLEAPELSDAALSVRITSSQPIIAERAMWWPSGAWHEAHNSAGALVTSPRWAVAEGEIGGTRALATYVLIANTSPVAAQVRVSVFFEDQGIVAPKVFGIGPRSRFNIDLGADFPESVGRRFSVLVEGLGDTPPELVVERAMYSNSGRTQWAAGTNALGTPLFPAETFYLTPGGVFPKKMVVDDGTRVQFINRDSVTHTIVSDTHPFHDECPAINGVQQLDPGQSRLTNNLVIDLGINACGFHDETGPQNGAMWGKIVIRP